MPSERSIRYPATWQLDADLRSRCQVFHERFQELHEFGRIRFPVEMTVSVTEGRLEVDADLPHEKEVRLAALAARHFLANDEPGNFASLRNRIFKVSPEERFRVALKKIHEDYSAFLRKPVSVASAPLKNGKAIERNEHLLDVYINGKYFHSDEAFREFLAGEREGFGPLFKREFVQILSSLYMHVEALDEIVQNALGIDLLARTPLEQAIQSVIVGAGVSPTAINVHCHPGAAQFDIPTQAQCSLQDDLIPEDKIEGIVRGIFRELLRGWPGRAVYQVVYRTSDGPRLAEIDYRKKRRVPPTDRAAANG